MLGSEFVNEWIVVEHAPSTHGGYRLQTKNVTEYQDGRPADIYENSITIKEITTQSILYAYRLTSYPYQKFRLNGLSSICIMDIVEYDYESKSLIAFASGLVNTMKSDSILMGAAVLRVGKSFQKSFDLPHPPEIWSEFLDWSKKLPARKIPEINIPSEYRGFMLNGLNSMINVKIREELLEFKLAQKYLLEDSYLCWIELTSSSGGNFFLKGVTSGSLNVRNKAIRDFLESIVDAIDLRD